MDILELTATIAGLAGLILTLTQLIKVQLGMTGRWVLVLSVLLGGVLGAVLASGGIAGLAVLTGYPRWLSGLVLGVLAGAVASGGKDVVTGIQITGAQERAKAQAKYAPTEVSGETSTDPAADWLPASIDDLGRTRTDWPEVPGLDEAPLADEPRLGRH